MGSMTITSRPVKTRLHEVVHEQTDDHARAVDEQGDTI
jgi:hypothetical protein